MYKTNKILIGLIDIAVAGILTVLIFSIKVIVKLVVKGCKYVIPVLVKQGKGFWLSMKSMKQSRSKAGNQQDKVVYLESYKQNKNKNKKKFAVGSDLF